MATFAIGDIHGNIRALTDLLTIIDQAISADDTVVFLGDYIDRGPDSKACIELIIDLQLSGKTKVVTLLGNHEQWLLRTYHDYTRHSWILGMEGLSTVRSYSPGAAADLEEEIGKLGRRIIGERVPLPYHLFFDSLPADHLAFFLSLRPFYRTADAVCVHGGLNPTGGTVEEQQPEQLIWGANGFPDHYQGNDSIIYGHANNPVFDDSGWPHPRIVGRTYGLDTIAEGVLTALRIPDATVFQSRRFS